MIAGSLMELSNGFNLVHSASISIRRYNGGMPVLLLHSGIFDRRTWYLFTITILLSSTTIASYFLSTGLVSDLGIAPIIGDATASTIGRFIIRFYNVYDYIKDMLMRRF